MKFRKEDATRTCAGNLRLSALSAALVAAFALPNVASAFEIPLGNDDFVMRWDNTVRLNVAQRVSKQDPVLLSGVNVDDGDRNFDRGTVFTRIDLLTEFDVIYKRAYGFRVSAAGWWDPAYDSLDNTSVRTSNTLVYGRPAIALSPTTKRYGEGPSGEFLDVFAFGTFEAGEVPISVKLGQTTVYWGDSLFLGGAIHGISYAQNPIDIWKGLATPGAEAKELFRPRVGFNIQAQVAQDLSISGQYFFNWQRFSNQAYRYPESGAYLAFNDAIQFGADSLILGANPFAAAFPGAPVLGRAFRTTDIEPDENKGNYGIGARWSPQWLDGTLGFYYRRTYDMQPQVMITPGVATLPSPAACAGIGGQPLAATSPTPCIINRNATNQASLLANGQLGTYNLAYGTDIDIIGLSLAKNIAGVSVGAELSYRRNMPLISDPIQVLPSALVATVPGAISTTAAANLEGAPGARGQTMHGVLNGLVTFASNPMFDAASLSGELTWMQWLTVSNNDAVFKGRSNYNQIDKVTKNFFGLGINFTPTWFQVFPGVDMLAPLSWSAGLSGNAAVTGGGNEDSGTWGAGVAFDIYQRYRIDLKYVAFYGNYSTFANGTLNTLNGNTGAALQDRDFWALTFKTTF